MKPNPNLNDRDAATRQRCLAYLLGELSERESAEFEASLDDKELSSALLRESDLLIGISAGEVSRCAAQRRPQQSLPCPTPPEIPSARSLFSKRALTVACAALAATLIIAVGFSRLKTDHRPVVAMLTADTPHDDSFELALAKAWVQPAVQWVAEEPEVPIDVPITETSDAVTEDASEESFEWMVAAVEASMPAGENNDG